MTSKSSYVVLAVNTVVLVCVVGWVLVQTGHAPREPAAAPRDDAGLRAQLDEVERQNEYLDQRIAGLERTTSEMRDLLESMPPFMLETRAHCHDPMSTAVSYTHLTLPTSDLV